MRMVVKSEYRRAFRPKFQCYVKVYEGNVDYRLQRRQVEACHSQDAFFWEDSDYETDSENSCNGDAKPRRSPRPASVPLHLYKHKKFNEAYQKRQESQREIVIQQGQCQPIQLNGECQNIAKTSPREAGKSKVSLRAAKVAVSPKVSPRSATESVEEEEQEGHRDRQVQTPDWSRVRRRSRNHRKYPVHQHKEQAVQTNGDQPLDTIHEVTPGPSAVSVDKPSRPQKPGQRVPRPKKSLAKPRPMSAPLGRPPKKSPPSPVDDKAPFIPYGFKDKEKETGTLKTHNVRSSVDVYPSALRALRRKQSDIADREKAAKEAPLRERRQKALFNDFDSKMKRETSQWDTEYRRHYVGYEKELYERHVCARTPPAQGLRPEVKQHHSLRASC